MWLNSDAQKEHALEARGTGLSIPCWLLEATYTLPNPNNPTFWVRWLHFLPEHSASWWKVGATTGVFMP